MGSRFCVSHSTPIGNAVRTVLAASLAAFAGHAWSAEEAANAEKQEGTDVAELSDIQVLEDPLRTLPNEVSGSSFGFAKPILETPRSVSFISRETIDLYNISAVEDLARVTPAVFTPSRYGIQGSIDVRGIPADTYIRGMKRFTVQGNARSVLAAMDTIEVVKGPPSPIYGMGKIGGYTNFVPKSGRAKIGGYLPEPQGYAQVIVGSLSREEFSAGVGGPMSVFGKQGGYYAYGLLEDADAYYIGTPYDQKVVQLASSVDRAIGPFRLETGGSYQIGDTAGSLSSRITTDYINTGRYIGGGPLIDLDVNGNGQIGFLEQHQASPVRGRVSAGNQPLVQYFAWPTDPSGTPLSADQFPQISGIPQNMLTYLNTTAGRAATNCRAADVIREIGATQTTQGPLPISGAVPNAFFLNPCTVHYQQLSDGERRRATAHERELHAVLAYAYFDLIYDENPDFTMKNQVFFDTIDQYKISNQPLFLNQDVNVFENKFTLTKRLTNTPHWLGINALGSVNVRRTSSATFSGLGGDWASSRLDVTDPLYKDINAGRSPANTFATAADNADITTDGQPISARGSSEFWEYGIGTLVDIDFFKKVNLVLGGRYDYSRAKNEESAGTFNANTGTSAAPGAYRLVGSSAKGSDSGASWSASFSYDVGSGVRPYITMAHATATLDGTNNRLSDSLVNLGHLGESEIKEAGVKSSLFNNSLFITFATYEQSRINVSYEDDDTLLSADVSSTITKGQEVEIKWIPFRGFNVSLFGVKQETKFNPNKGGQFLVDARFLGFQDVVDPATGQVLFPAEAFLYGGRASIVLPDNMKAYDTRPTQPEYQYGTNMSYMFENGMGFTLSGNYMSEVCGGRMCLVELPSVTTGNLGVFATIKDWELKFDVTNLTDKDYYRPRQYNTAADMLYTAMPGRRFALTAKMNFR
jgi:outer membrane receptor protein involved in Fe transport